MNSNDMFFIATIMLAGAWSLIIFIALGYYRLYWLKSSSQALIPLPVQMKIQNVFTPVKKVPIEPRRRSAL